MRLLTLIRHAKSSWDDTSLADFDRPLNGRGLKNAPAMANSLPGKIPMPDLFLISDSVRTQATAAYFLEAFEAGEDRVKLDHRIYEASFSTLLDVIGELPDSIEHAAVIGHNPGITRLHDYLVHPPKDNIPTCGVAHIRINQNGWSSLPSQCGELLLYATPKSIGR